MHAQKNRHPSVHKLVVAFLAQAKRERRDEEGEFVDEGVEGADFDVGGGGGEGLQMHDERREVASGGG